MVSVVCHVDERGQGAEARHRLDQLFQADLVEDLVIDGEIMNLIMPQSLQGEVYQDVGDIFTYCITSES